MSYSESDASTTPPEPSQEPTVTEDETIETDQASLDDAPIGDGDNAVGATPPGFEWSTHGGYLGCLIGCLASFLIGGFLGSALLGTLYVVGGGTAVVLALVSVVVYACLVYGLCRLGWFLGKRYYRSYQEVGDATWGEHDELDYEVTDTAVVADAPAETDDSADTSDPQAFTGRQDEVQSGLPASGEGMRA